MRRPSPDAWPSSSASRNLPAAPGEAFWAVRRLLESLARKQPIVVAFDDIHWAEPTLLDLVEYLGEWRRDRSLSFCLCTRRSSRHPARLGRAHIDRVSSSSSNCFQTTP